MASNVGVSAQIHLAEKVDGRDAIANIPDHGFRVKLNHRFSKKGKPFFSPRLHQLPTFIGLSIRYMIKWNKIRREGKKMWVDIRDAIPLQQIYGVPLGGIGCGSIGRGYRGEFGRFQMVPGMYKWKVIHGDQFILTIRKNGQTVYQQVLSSHKPPPKRLKAWKWGFDGSKATYHGLYPRSWTTYEITEFNVKLTCRQISPVIPHDYKESCLPVGVFVWTIENRSDDDLDISITLAFQSGIGRRGVDLAGGIWNERFDYQTKDVKVSGVGIHQNMNGMDCTYLISSKHNEGNKVTECLFFDPMGDGSSVWGQLQSAGHLISDQSKTDPTGRGEMAAAAVCVQTSVKSKTAATAEFCVAWHMPLVQFGGKKTIYKRRYARWFSGADAGKQLCAHALTEYHDWEMRINAWQTPVLKSSLPSWYKSAIFNELYFVSDGGSIWLDLADEENNADDGFNKLYTEYGKFAYLEGHEYRMFNTYDVHFYASFALIMNWPMIQLSLQYDIAHAIGRSIPHTVSYIADGKHAPIKEQHCVPHDIGGPEDDPWDQVNCYNLHATGDWKDLNSKFVLQVMRDYHVTKNTAYLEDMFPTILDVMKRSLQFDVDDDGMIENSGYPDQTYDTWTATGTSAYCGGLWLAAIRCTIEICKILKKTEHVAFYQQLLDRASKSYDTKLWNGKYYNYDSSSSSHHAHIMSDQLCGHWYLKACGINDEQIFPSSKVKSALKVVFENNVQRFGGGHMGAINGCKPNGKPDRTTVQSEEFWTGVSYALSANFIQEDMLSEAFQTSYGVYREVYEMRGLAYQTPEAYMENEVYRSLGYMRPLAIWSIQWAIEQYHKELLNGTTVLERCHTLASQSSIVSSASAATSGSSDEYSESSTENGTDEQAVFLLDCQQDGS